VLVMNLRLGGMTIVQQQGMEVLGVNLSPSVSVKDRFAVRPHVMLNACLTLSWPDKSFRPRSLRVHLRPDTSIRLKCAARLVARMCRESMA